METHEITELPQWGLLEDRFIRTNTHAVLLGNESHQDETKAQERAEYEQWEDQNVARGCLLR